MRQERVTLKVVDFSPQRTITLYINEIQCYFIYQRIWNELNNLSI